MESNIENTEDEDDPPVTKRVEVRRRRKPKAYSQDNLMESYDPIIEPGPSSMWTPHVPDNEIRNKEIKKQTPSRVMHQSLILNSTDNRTSISTIQRSQSTNDFCHTSGAMIPRELRSLYDTESCEDNEINNQFYDTNIRHNDRYPEANDVDNLDNEIMDALTLETGNLPDLTEEQSSSIDESTRRDDLCSEPLAIENLIYLNRILSLDQEGFEGQSLESEWEAFGEGCEHLHHVLKYWNYLVLPFPELRQAVSWGQVKCYCSNCQPDEDDAFSGWVRIERIDGVGAASRGFWHISRSTLGAAQVVNSDFGIAKRPRSLASSPSNAISLGDIWLDEESKPHHTILAIEIDIEGNDANKDRLLAFLIHMKSHQVFVDDPLSLDE